ncbi:hypothetical protein ACHAXS_010976 [Conticribra weissflogii]
MFSVSLITGRILENPVGCIQCEISIQIGEGDQKIRCLSTKTVESLSLALERIHYIHGRHSLTTSVLSVRDRVADHVLEEDLQHSSRLLVNETGNTLHAATTRETTDGGLGDALDVVAKDLSVALGASFSETFASFTAAGHD